MEVGTEIHIPYVKYWLAVYRADVDVPDLGDPTAPHDAWGLSEMRGFDGENDLYIFTLVDPQRYMLTCITHGW